MLSSATVRLFQPPLCHSAPPFEGKTALTLLRDPRASSDLTVLVVTDSPLPLLLQDMCHPSSFLRSNGVVFGSVPAAAHGVASDAVINITILWFCRPLLVINNYGLRRDAAVNGY
ncbi:hypothetical protein PIB30_026781 [Stylosanthes scabra]|uniref:Uncharacterized protein n=1 Tax=Stylosanthes scabra TaxID=79078 RepID=A0ABU6Y980_9FABA|nr:hypothetical protein [Stylosanthes scabra]